MVGPWLGLRSRIGLLVEDLAVGPRRGDLDTKAMDLRHGGRSQGMRSVGASRGVVTGMVGEQERKKASG